MAFRAYLASRLPALLGLAIASLVLLHLTGRLTMPQATLEEALVAGTQLPVEGAWLPARPATAWTDAYHDQPSIISAGGDVWMVPLRLTATGSAMTVGNPYNLTATPMAKEDILVRQGPFLICAVRVFGQIQSALLMSLTGDERLDEAQDELASLMFQISNRLETGSYQGVAMRVYSFPSPPKGLEAHMEGHMAVLTLPSGQVRIDARDGHIEEGAELVSYIPRPLASKNAVAWLVDTVRGFSWVGPERIAWLEKVVFNAVDLGRQALYTLGLMSGDGGLAEELVSAGVDVSGTQEAQQVTAEGMEATSWRPKDIEPLVTPAQKGEGLWLPITFPWLALPKDSPPAFYKTVIRTDPSRPFSNVVMVAMDLGRLELNMTGGTATPASATGIRGTGRIPRKAGVLRRVVAAMNGGFQTAHGTYGMVVDGQVIMPPMAKMGTIVKRWDGIIEMGDWNNSMNVPAFVQALRQNMLPLVADGAFNPHKNRWWGGTLSDLDQAHSPRSGICMIPDRTFIYMWGPEPSAQELGRAMNAAGCTYGIHLDMNPTHTGYAFLSMEVKDRGDEGEVLSFKDQRLSSRMSFDNKRFVHRNAKDFFYLTVRNAFHEELPALPEGFTPWQGWPEAGAARGVVSRSTGPHGEVLLALNRSRLRGLLQRGTSEPDPTSRLASSRPSAPLSIKHPLAILNLGSVRAEGLIEEGRIYVPPQEGLTSLAVLKDGTIEIVSTGAALPPECHSLRQGPSLVVRGKPVGSVGALESLGQDPQGKLYYLSLPDQPERAPSLLEALGVSEAMALLPSSRPCLRVVVPGEGGLVGVDPAQEQARPLLAGPLPHSRLALGLVPDQGPWIRRMHLPDEELSPQEQKRQKSLAAKISTMREELRKVANAQYEAYIEKLKAKRAAEGKP